ncbi:MAG TPA: hypothetical protein VGK46_14905 [Saprospiraceae bacterium]|jgi:hypothetical protein
MKTILTGILMTLTTTFLMSQEGNPNTMSVMVNGKEYKTEPHRIKIGAYGYITGNAISPDISLRIWLGSYDGKDLNEPGKYLVIGEHDNPAKEDSITAAYMTGQYKGIAYVKYVEETKSPRMEYHVGESKWNGETINVVNTADGYQDITFNVTLDGSTWKEKTSTTAFGGLNRLTNKLEDKAVTGATGYEQNIDPEGAGYKKQKELDVIKLTEGKVKIKLKG